MYFTTYYPTGQPYIIEARVNGKRNGTVCIYDVTSREISMLWYDNIQVYYSSYRQNGRLHNLHGPALIMWDNNEQINYISYAQNGLKHNLHGPTHMEWYDNCQICYIQFHHFGKLIKEYDL